MRTVSSDMNTHCQQELTTLCDCISIARGDGITKYFTTADFSLTIDGHIYKPYNVDTPTAVDMKLDMSVDNADGVGFFSTDQITVAEIAGRVYDGARVRIFKQNWADTSMAPVDILTGFVGNVTRQGNQVRVEFRSLQQALALNICSLLVPKCRSLFGNMGSGSSGGCRYPTNPTAWAAGIYHYAIRDLSDPQGVNRIGGGQDHVVPTTLNGYQYNCTTSGISGSTEPTWPTTLGSTVTDGTVVWTAVPAVIRAGSISAVTDSRHFTVTGLLGQFPVVGGGDFQATANPDGHGLWDGGGTTEGTVTITNGGSGFTSDATVTATYQLSGITTAVQATSVSVTGDAISAIEFPYTIEGQKPVASDVVITAEDTSVAKVFFVPGFVRWLNGNNQYIKREIFALTHSGSNWIVTTVDPLPFTITVGDDVQMIASCDQTKTQCRGYSNLDNFRAEDAVPGPDTLYHVYPGGKKSA